MKHFIFLLTAFFVALTVNADNSPQTPLIQQGLAVRETPDKHIILNYLFLQQPAKGVSAIHNAAGNKRMHLINAGKIMSSRWLKKLWREDIVINNSRGEYEPFQDQINQFISIFNQPLYSGDELSIETNNNQQTLVFINQQQVAGFEGTQIFDLLLNTWLGSAPPSRVFKQQIMGNLTSDKAIQLDTQLSLNKQAYYEQDEQLSGL